MNCTLHLALYICRAERGGVLLPVVIPFGGGLASFKPAHFVLLFFFSENLKASFPFSPNKKNRYAAAFMDAERGGFEPPDPLRDQRFSRPPRSTTLASLPEFKCKV
jgi:hypothetical protein